MLGIQTNLKLKHFKEHRLSIIDQKISFENLKSQTNFQMENNFLPQKAFMQASNDDLTSQMIKQKILANLRSKFCGENLRKRNEFQENFCLVTK